MKKLVLASVLIAGFAAPAVGQIPGRPIKEYTTKAGTTFHKGDTIQLARGLRDDGSFRYAVIPLQPFHDSETSLPAAWNRRRPVVSSVREIPFKTGRVVTLAFKAGAFTATLDPESAEESGEIITAANQQKATPAASGGVADELLKSRLLAMLKFSASTDVSRRLIMQNLRALHLSPLTV